MVTVKSEIGQFGMVPRWVLELGLSSRAIHLYCVLACKYADREGQAFPSRTTLASDLGGVHESTIDRAVQELERSGALEVHRKRKNGHGGYCPNLLVVRAIQPDRSAPVPVSTSDEPPVSTSDEPPVSTSDEPPVSTSDEQTIPKINHTHKEPDPVPSSLRSEGTGGMTAAKKSSPPDPRVKEVMTWVEEQRSYVSPAHAAEAKAVKWMLDHQYTPEQIQQVYSGMKQESFWSTKELTMMTIKSQIGAKLNAKPVPVGAQNGRSPQWRTQPLGDYTQYPKTFFGEEED